MNRKIVFSGVIIMATGLIKAVTSGGGFTKVFVGSYIFLLMLGIADSLGGRMSQFTGAIAIIAALGILLTQFPWQTILSAVGGSGKSSGTKKTTGSKKG
jgi:hypothetical protein